MSGELTTESKRIRCNLWRYLPTI